MNVRTATPEQFKAAAERVIARHGGLFRRLAKDEAIELLRSMGFTDGDWFKDLTDRPIRGLVYLTRTHEGQHQYLSLLYAPWDEVTWLEAVLLVYEAPFNSRAKVRQQPLCARTLRSLDEVMAAVGTVYPPLPPEPKAAPKPPRKP